MDLQSFPPPGYQLGPSKIAGIEVYQPSSTNQKRADIIDFKCPKCGATIAYDVSQGKLSCEYCGYSEAPEAQALGQQAEQFEFKVETMLRAQQGWGDDRKELACQRCGGVISVPPDILTYTCPFCGSNKVLFREPMEDVLRPRFLIPFKIDPQTCQIRAKKWLGNSWMLPAELRSVTVEQFHPLYIPYWTFDALCNASWRAMVPKATTDYYEADGKKFKNTKVEMKEETGKIQKLINGLLVPGTTRLNMKTLGQIDGYDLQDLILYEPKYLAGMQAQAYDLPLEEAWQVGRQIMRERTRQACLDRASSSNVEDFRMRLDFDNEAWRYILVPVYTSIYTFDERNYQFLINGQTGKVAGMRPVDWKKVWLVIACMLAPGLLVGLIGQLNASSEAGILTSGLGMMLVVIAVAIAFFIIRQGQEMEHD